MADPIFRVDLSPDARDFQATATEPGLPMLDRQTANYAILRRWFGDLVAEPEWEDAETVRFFWRDPERGRLSDVECRPATKADLEGPLAAGVQSLRAKLKRAAPESSTEQLLHRVARQAFTRITSDPEAGDCDSYMFKCRQGTQPWQLVWCWGYQRSDLQPAPAVICTKAECRHLYVRRPKTKPLCPICDTVAGRRRRAGWLVRLPVTLLLLLLAGAVLVALLAPPKLVITPSQWSGPVGSQVDFHVAEHRWLVLQKDVTPWARFQTHDSRVIAFDEHGRLARAKTTGRTLVSFRYGNRVADAAIEVLPPAPPQRLAIEPESVTIAVGTTQKLKAIGYYADDRRVDVTDIARWRIEDTSLATFCAGGVEGVAAGQTTVAAIFPAAGDQPEDAEEMTATAPLEVIQADIQSLAVRVVPDRFGVNQSSRVEVSGLSDEGRSFSLSGSSRLALQVEPAEAADIDGEYVLGRVPGPARLLAAFQSLKGEITFTVGANTSLAGGVLSVTPSTLELSVDEYYELDVATASDSPIEATSSDPAVVQVMGPRQVAARAPGEATVTVAQDGNSRVVQVRVREGTIEQIAFAPEAVVLEVGGEQIIDLYGVTSDGLRVLLAPDRVTWVKQPKVTDVQFDRLQRRLVGLRVTPQPQDVQVVYQDRLSATASVEVVGDTSLALLAEEQFMVHPPIAVRGLPVPAAARLGHGLLYRGRDVVVSDASPFSVLGEIPTGSVLRSVNGNVLSSLDAGGVRRYLAENPISVGDMIEYRAPDGSLATVSLGTALGAVQDVRMVDVKAVNLSGEDFQAEIRLMLRRKGEYRISDTEGHPLSQWSEWGPDATVSVTTTKIGRTPDDEYEIYVDRRIDEIIKRFQIPFNLEPEDSR